MTNWEVRKQSPHYLFYSLERFRMVQILRKLRFLLLLLILDMVEEDSGGSLTILCMDLRMMSIQDHLHALRPYNFYPPVGFYPTGTHDPYWTRSARHEELFLKRFRFRLPDIHRLMRAMKMDGEYFTCDTGKKYPADLCMMVSWYFSGVCRTHAHFGNWLQNSAFPRTGSAKFFTLPWNTYSIDFMH